MSKAKENVIFFKSLIREPLKTGAFLPSSKNLAAFVSSHLSYADDGYIVEIGAGTGSLTKAILKKGICPSRLIIIEMQPVFAEFLRKLFPHVIVIEGDAKNLQNILPEYAVGKVQTIVSGIPMVNLKFTEQLNIIKACKQVIAPFGNIIQFTYRPGSPLPSEKLGIYKKYLGSILLNMPPASVWQYTFDEQAIHNSKIFAKRRWSI
jgi:phosphatidylethanolamine/phosphatidyl-N-methylethanolamine N-methyltransferase